jgi:hypothetical protein
MGGNQTKPGSSTNESLKPIIDDYVDKVRKIQNICTTCEENWNAKIVKNAISFGNLTVEPQESSEQQFLMILAKVNDKKTRADLKHYVINERTSAEAHASKVMSASITYILENILQAYARDVFKLIAQQLRATDPWRTASNDVMVLVDILGSKWYDRAKIALVAVRDSKREFEKYYSFVTEESLYRDPASSGTTPKQIITAPDWAQAIRTLPRVYELLDSHYTPIYTSMMTEANIILSKKAA